ncbi:MAG: hypothetical protein ACYC5G_01080 [Candidatus Doudnabacteria bacterium]
MKKILTAVLVLFIAAGCNQLTNTAKDLDNQNTATQITQTAGPQKTTTAEQNTPAIIKQKNTEPEPKPTTTQIQNPITETVPLQPQVPQIDFCLNIEDAQSTVPDGLMRDNQSNCVAPAPTQIITQPQISPEPQPSTSQTAPSTIAADNGEFKCYGTLSGNQNGYATNVICQNTYQSTPALLKQVAFDAAGTWAISVEVNDFPVYTKSNQDSGTVYADLSGSMAANKTSQLTIRNKGNVITLKYLTVEISGQSKVINFIWDQYLSRFVQQ